MINNWDKLFNLIKRTGDRLVVVDKTGKDVYVVMDIDQYQDLLSERDDFYDDFEYDENEMNFDFQEEDSPESFPSSEELDNLLGGNEEQENKLKEQVDDYYYIEPVN